MCVFGGCESGMNLPPNPLLGKTRELSEKKYLNLGGRTIDEYNAWLQHAATDVNAKKHHKKEHPSWWLSQADIDKFDPKPLTRWQRFWAWWRK